MIKRLATGLLAATALGVMPELIRVRNQYVKQVAEAPFTAG
ncbi:hypothetical protein [Streptosporangium sp. NPDC048865]